MSIRRSNLLRAGVALLMACCAMHSFAQGANSNSGAWPQRPTKLIVPTAPGLASDVLARVVADGLAGALGQPWIVDNRAGAGGMVGLAAAAKSKPDGYTLAIVSSGPLTIGPAVMSNMAFDPVKDFEPVANIALTPQAIFVAANGPYKTLSDLISASRRKDLPFGIPPLGSTGHLAYAAFAKSAKVSFNLVPFRGNMDTASQVIAGDVAAMYDTVPGSLPLVKGGKLRALAVAAPQRSPFLPDTPTLAELGFGGAEAVGWIGLAAPAGTPKVIVDKLGEKLRVFLATPKAGETFKSLAFVPAPDSTRDAFAQTIRSELSRWSALAKEMNLRIE